MNVPVGRYVVEIAEDGYDLPAAWGPGGELLIEVELAACDDDEETWP